HIRDPKTREILTRRPLRSCFEHWLGSDGIEERGQDEAPKGSQPDEDAAEVVADGGEDDVGGIAGAAFEVAAADVAFGLEVSDDGLDGGAAAQFALDDTEDAALL